MSLSMRLATILTSGMKATATMTAYCTRRMSTFCGHVRQHHQPQDHKHRNHSRGSQAPSTEACSQEGAGLLPRHNASQHALGHHPDRSVMHLGKCSGHLMVHRQQGLLPRPHHLVLASLTLSLNATVSLSHRYFPWARFGLEPRC